MFLIITVFTNIVLDESTGDFVLGEITTETELDLAVIRPSSNVLVRLRGLFRSGGLFHPYFCVMWFAFDRSMNWEIEYGLNVANNFNQFQLPIFSAVSRYIFLSVLFSL